MLACGEGNGEDVGKCVEVWGLNTLLIPHISSLPSPFPTSPLTSPTPHHTFLHLSYLFPHPFFLPPHPNTFSYYPHISLHLLKVWQSYHVTKFVWRSYWQPVLTPLLLPSYLHAITLIVLLLLPFSCAAFYSPTLIYFYCVDT